MREKQKIIVFIKKVRRRLTINQIVTYLFCGGAGGFSVGMLLNLIAIWLPFYGAFSYSLLIGSGLTIAAGMIGLVKRPTMQAAALYADSKGFSEGLTTALEAIDEESIFHSLQKEQVCRLIQQFSLKTAIPYQLSLKKAGMFLSALVGCVVIGLIPSPAKAIAEGNHALKEVIKEHEGLIEQVIEEIHGEETVSADEKAVLTELLEAALQELEKMISEEELSKVLERLDKKLEKEVLARDSEAFEALAEQVAESLNLPFEQNQQSQMANLDDLMDDLIKETLESLMSDGEDGASQKLTEALSEQQLEELTQMMKESLMNGDISDMDIGQLTERFGINEGQFQEAMDSLAEATTGIRQAAQSGGSETGEGSDGTESDGTMIAAGQGNGQAGGQTESDGEGLSGTGWNQGSREGFEKVSENQSSVEELMIPNRNLGDDENLTGISGMGSTYVTESPDGLTWSGSSMDYQQVLGEYSAQAESRIRNTTVPEGVKDIIRDYFSGLSE